MTAKQRKELTDALMNRLNLYMSYGATNCNTRIIVQISRSLIDLDRNDKNRKECNHEPDNT